MKRFENAQVGDLVYSRIHGDGIIAAIYDECLRIRSEEDNFLDMTYNINGHFFYNVGEPILFYRNGSERYLTERPEPEIDWKKVPMGTKVYCANRINEKAEEVDYFVFYNPKHNYPFWILVGENKAAGYKYCKLAEPCKPEWIKKD